MNTNEENDQDNKKTVLKESDRNIENETSGETSSAAHFDRTGFTKTADRKSRPLGSSHEPGTTPGVE